jgi:hypothetical protein
VHFVVPFNADFTTIRVLFFGTYGHKKSSAFLRSFSVIRIGLINCPFKLELTESLRASQIFGDWAFYHFQFTNPGRIDITVDLL